MLFIKNPPWHFIEPKTNLKFLNKIRHSFRYHLTVVLKRMLLQFLATFIRRVSKHDQWFSCFQWNKSFSAFKFFLFFVFCIVPSIVTSFNVSFNISWKYHVSYNVFMIIFKYSSCFYWPVFNLSSKMAKMELQVWIILSFFNWLTKKSHTSSQLPRGGDGYKGILGLKQSTSFLLSVG